VTSTDDRRLLQPITAPRRYQAAGLALQFLGVGAPTLSVGLRAHRESLGGHLTAATVRLAWHAQGHTPTGLALLLVGACIFALGSVVLARPYVRRRRTLIVAVPVAAIVGMFVLGGLALILALVAAAVWDSWGDVLFDWTDFSGGGRRRRRAETTSPGDLQASG